MRHIVTIFFLSSLLYAQSINIAVAANVSYAMDALKAAFVKKHPETKLQITIGGSGKLTAQIKNGAPYDLFLSANMRYPQSLYKEGFALTQPKIYAQGALAILSLQPRDFSQGIYLLKDKSIRRIAIANPKTAPYGKAAMQALRSAGLYRELQSRFIYGESIAQTLTYTLTAADIGFIAKSALYSSKLKRFKEGRNWVSVDKSLYDPIDQGVVLLKRAKANKEAKAFVDFLLTQEAKEIFRAYGYTVL